ncbi:uncharacterized protein [Epargyreus clarus]|uniref:uncharacterized protein n=1 Tax=Epargyreus clarus TaxID=520877 RepID=UPI003C2DFD39
MKRKSTKMKELLIVVSLLLSGAVGEPPAPYPPAGWRPNGPSFELPARVPAQNPQKQEYLPPVQSRGPLPPQDFDSGVDVSVQGLPTVEQQPIFQISPINGQQYSGPNYQADIRNLDQQQQQIQYQQQLAKQREFARQRQFEAERGNARANGLPNPQPPRQFVPQATTTTTQKPEFKTETSTEPLDLNEGEDYDDSKDTDTQKQKVSVEVTKQNIQEYPPELFLTPLTQFKIQPQFIQLGQLRAPLYYQPIRQEPEVQKAEGYDGPAHFAALPSVLAQQQLLTQAQAAPQPQPAFNQNPGIIIARGQEQPAYVVPQEPLTQYQPNQYQPVIQPQAQAYPQFQPVVLPPQTSNQLQPNPYAQPIQPQPESEDVETNDDDQAQAQPQPQQPQFVYQPNYQPSVYQQFPQPVPNQYQPQEQVFAQPQLVNYAAQDWNQYYQNQLYPQQFADPNQVQIAQQNQGQDSLQSGLDINQQGNGIDQDQKDQEDPEDEQDGSRATAVSTAFGARTQPRVFAQYGAPVTSRPQAFNPGYTTTDAPQEEQAEDGPAVAQATAVATGSRKSAKLRSRRVRPIFTLDRSGHLVLAQEQ